MNEKDDNFKLNMSFEDAMKKAATTKVDPAIPLLGLGKQQEIYNVSGKKVLLINLTIAGKDVTNFYLIANIKNSNAKERKVRFKFKRNPKHPQSAAALFHKQEGNPIEVPIGGSLIISIMPKEDHPNETFEVGALTYRILDA